MRETWTRMNDRWHHGESIDLQYCLGSCLAEPQYSVAHSESRWLRTRLYGGNEAMSLFVSLEDSRFSIRYLCVKQY